VQEYEKDYQDDVPIEAKVNDDMFDLEKELALIADAIVPETRAGGVLVGGWAV